MPIRSKTYGNIINIGDLYLTGTLRITNANYLFKLTTNSGTVAQTPAGAVASPTRKKIKITIDDVVYYFLAATDWITGNSPSISPSPSRSPSASRSPSTSVSPSS